MKLAQATIVDMQNNSKTILIGAPLDLGAEDLGTYEGPQALRARKLIQKLVASGLDIEDFGDIVAGKRESLSVTNPLTPYSEEIVRANTQIATRVHEELQSSRRVVVVGGDHSINLGAFSGASRAFGADIGLIYIDAHGDMNTPQSSTSHNIHGMHLASLMGFGPADMTGILGPEVKLKKENLLHIGASDLDPAEKELIANENLCAFTLFDLLTKGMGELIKLIDDLRSRTSAIWVSLDLDAIDWVYAPGVGIPNQGGLSYREIAAITDYIGTSCNVVGMDIVEYNPKMDIDHKTAELSIELIAKILGSNYSWYTNYMSRQSK